MKHTVFVLLAVIACIFMIAAGCTSSSGTATTATPTASPAATPQATPATPANTTAQPNVTTSAAPSFAGNWNATWKSGSDAAIVSVIHIEQTGTAVTGTYTYFAAGNVTGAIRGTVDGSTLTGTWNETAANTTYSGPLVFTISSDANSFTGKWASSTDAAGAINTTADYWNGVRV
ncbi:MAG: hypothetical protein LUQ31_10830 [Methanoregula sp.]|nr:hypothetical protein [Methanoregula sp.]